MAESLDEVVGGVGGAAPHDGPEDRQERLEGHAVVRPMLVHQLLHVCRCMKLNHNMQENMNGKIELTRFCWVLPEGPHDVADVGDGDLAVAAVVVKQEGLLELGQLVLRKLLLHPARHDGWMEGWAAKRGEIVIEIGDRDLYQLSISATP